MIKQNIPFLLLKEQSNDSIKHIELSDAEFVSRLDDAEKKYNQSSKDLLMLLPFSSIEEKYSDIDIKFKNKIFTANIDTKNIINLSDIVDFYKRETEISNLESFYSDDNYRAIVKSVIENEIKKGSGSNFTIANKVSGNIANFNHDVAVGIFARLCINEYGSYQTFCLYTNDFYIIGSSPECHLNIHNGRVRMQPISGTYRKTKRTPVSQKLDLLSFIKEKKEINELFTTVDEELKMMAKICSSGGMIIGPRLREMSKVIHTEYLLTGQTKMNVFDAIKESMHAATVIGSPLKSGVLVSEKYNCFDKKYYGGLIGIIDRDNNFDSSIIIRTALINKNGQFEICSGASIVQDSNPENELAEIKAKLSSLVSNISSGQGSIKENKLLDTLGFDHDVCESLYVRNQNLSSFWFFDRSINNGDKFDKNIDCIIVNNDDDFTNMLYHMLFKINVRCRIVHYSDFNFSPENKTDLIIIGPGPGNPNDINEKNKKITELSKNLFLSSQKFAGICLGHQIISRTIGFEVKNDGNSTQGEQREINYFGKKELVGLYNTFYAKYDQNISKNLSLSYNPDNCNIYGIRGKNFFSIQFHPESLLTQNGDSILKNEIGLLFNL